MEKGFNSEQVIQEFEALTKDAKRIQVETLKKILKENCEAEYLKKWRVDGTTDPKTYSSCVPLITHKDVEPYIQKIADGAPYPVLTVNPITAFSLSSGTTQGKRKYLPFNDVFTKITTQVLQTSFAFRNREFPIENGKALNFTYAGKQFKTKSGLIATIASTNVFHSKEYKKTMKPIQTPSCSPDEVIFGPEYHQSLYCHLLCGLVFHEEIQVISSTFAHSIVHSFRTFELVWEELCNDIRTGVLSARIIVPSVRTAMAKILKPNPELADHFNNKCLLTLNNNWYGLIPEIFPNIKYIYTITTGSMAPYLKKLRHYAREVSLQSGDYGSSEGWIGVNVNPSFPPEKTTFVALPNIHYYEFLPLSQICDSDSDDSVLVEPKSAFGLTDVKIGEEYEIVITTFLGLYRYRLGDVVKVIGFHNSTPEFQFICRRNVLLNINVDKNTEKDLELSVETAVKLLTGENLEIVDYTSHADVDSEPGHYVIFWEVNGEIRDGLLKECCDCLDVSFVEEGYVSSRKSNTIGPLEVRVLSKGTFQKILDHFVQHGSVLNQYKTPRCVSAANHSVLKILCDNVVKSCFSTAFD